jgi:hypothetical protein
VLDVAERILNKESSQKWLLLHTTTLGKQYGFCLMCFLCSKVSSGSLPHLPDKKKPKDYGINTGPFTQKAIFYSVSFWFF